MNITPKVAERFNEKHIPVTESGCWIWTACIDRFGYGLLNVDRRSRHAHRVSWAINRGAIPDGMHVLHHCDIPQCVNPSHLYLGKDAENARDRKARNRGSGPKPKLTKSQILEIRSSNERTGVLADRYHVSLPTIVRLRGRKHVLTNEASEAIKSSRESTSLLAARYGVSAQTIIAHRGRIRRIGRLRDKLIGK